MLENPYKYLREDFEFIENGYRLTQKKLAEEFHDKKKPYFCDTLTHEAIRKIETNKRNVSDNEMNAYRVRFNTTSDYLLGFTGVPYGKKEDIEMIERVTGLSYSSIEMLKILTRYRNEYKNFMPGLGADIDALNAMLEYEYDKTQKAGEYIASWSVFHYIRQYLSSGTYEREQQDNLRVCDGKIWLNLKKGDVITREKKEHVITDMEALNSKSNRGSNTKKINIVNTGNHNERYTLDVNKAFQSYSRDNILEELTKIKIYIEEKKRKRK